MPCSPPRRAGPRPWPGCATPSAPRDPRFVSRPTARIGRRRRLLPRRPFCARRRALAPEVFAPLPSRRRAAPARRGGPRRVPGDRQLQRRHRRGSVARGGAAPAPGRLRLRRIGTIIDGGDARPAAAILQGRPGDAPAEDPGRAVRRVHRAAFREDRHPSRGRLRDGRPRSRRSPAVRRPAPRARNVGRCPGGGREAGWPRAPPHHAATAARRAGRVLRGDLAAAHAPQRAALRALVLEDGVGLLGADVRARCASAALVRAGGAGSSAARTS